MAFRRRGRRTPAARLDQTLAGAIAIADAVDPREIADRAASELSTLLATARCLIVHVQNDELASIGSVAADLGDAEVGAVAVAYKTGRPRFVVQASHAVDGAATGAGSITVMALPLNAGSRLYGAALCTWDTAVPAPTSADARAARLLCATAALALSRYALDHRITQLAETDRLTGAHTRDSLQAFLETLRDRGQACALVVLDLDGFAVYNERMGHDEGDRLLVALASMVGTECREGDVMARSGPDEFTLVLPGQTVESGTAAARRLVAAVTDWGHEDVVTVSAGVAGAIAGSRADVLALASRALDEARRTGSGRIGVA